MRTPWPLAPAHLSQHGSFGACPTEVLRYRPLRDEMEANPVLFLSRELDGRLAAARAALAPFIGADADDLAFVTNATSGVNAVLRSLAFAAGDELLATDHTYNACKNTLDYVARRAGATVVVATVPFPVASAADVMDAVMAKVTKQTRLALIDHVTSPTALVLPIERLTAELAARVDDGPCLLAPMRRSWSTPRPPPARWAPPTTAATVPVALRAERLRLPVGPP